MRIVHDTTCICCGGYLLFSARQRGEGLCWPCSRLKDLEEVKPEDIKEINPGMVFSAGQVTTFHPDWRIQSRTSAIEDEQDLTHNDPPAELAPEVDYTAAPEAPLAESTQCPLCNSNAERPESPSPLSRRVERVLTDRRGSVLVGWLIGCLTFLAALVVVL